MTISKLTDNRRVFLKYATKGEFFGASTLFCDEDSPEFLTCVTAKTKCKILIIPQSCMIQFLSSSPESCLDYIKFLSKKIRFLNSRIDSYTTDTAEARLLKYLCSLPAENGEITLNTSISKLSEHLNIGRASLYRSFDALEAQGKIIKNGKKIKLNI